jgi:predicted nucleic acid-binding protein
MQLLKLQLNSFQDHRLSHSLALADAFIAAAAKILDIELFTYNVKDYKFINQLNLVLPEVS